MFFSVCACVCLYFFSFFVVCFASFVPVCIWYAYLSYTQAQQRERERARAFEKSLRSRLQLIQNVVISSVEIAHTFFKYMALLKCMRKNGFVHFFPLSFPFCLAHSFSSVWFCISCFLARPNVHRLSGYNMYTHTHIHICEHSNTAHKVCDRNISSKCVPCVTLNYTVTVLYTWKFRFRT